MSDDLIELITSFEYEKKRIEAQERVFVAIQGLLKVTQSCGFQIQQDGILVSVMYVGTKGTIQ